MKTVMPFREERQPDGLSPAPLRAPVFLPVALTGQLHIVPCIRQIAARTGRP